MYQTTKCTILSALLFASFAGFGIQSADAGVRSSTGWLPYGSPVQWKVTQYDSHFGSGTEIRYFFQNHRSNPVTVTGRFKYTNTDGNTRYEDFKVTVKAKSKRGGAWDGRVFFVNHHENWKMVSFNYSN